MGAVTNRRRPHNHESMQITSPGKFADHPLPRRQLPRLLPLPPAKSGKSIPEPGDGGILDNLPGMAEVSLPATRPAGQAYRAEHRGGSPPRKTGRCSEQRRKLRFHVRRRKDGRRNDRRPGRQTPGGLHVHLHRRRPSLREHGREIPQQTGSGLFQPHPSVPRPRRENPHQTEDARTRNQTRGYSRVTRKHRRP